MTAEQLEELIGWVTPEDFEGDWFPPLNREGEYMNVADHTLTLIAPSLARRVIAAEKLARAVDAAFTAGGSWEAVSLATHAYREAGK